MHVYANQSIVLFVVIYRFENLMDKCYYFVCRIRVLVMCIIMTNLFNALLSTLSNIFFVSCQNWFIARCVNCLNFTV